MVSARTKNSANAATIPSREWSFLCCVAMEANLFLTETTTAKKRFASMATQQRKLHSLEGIVAAFALFFVLALTIGFAQAQTQKVVYLRSAAVMVQDAATGEIVINKNSEAVVPIASITKLMTAMIILDRGLDLEQRIVVSREDVDTVKGTRSRLMPGTTLTRDELLL